MSTWKSSLRALAAAGIFLFSLLCGGCAYHRHPFVETQTALKARIEREVTRTPVKVEMERLTNDSPLRLVVWSPYDRYSRSDFDDIWEIPNSGLPQVMRTREDGTQEPALVWYAVNLQDIAFESTGVYRPPLSPPPFETTPYPDTKEPGRAAIPVELVKLQDLNSLEVLVHQPAEKQKRQGPYTAYVEEKSTDRSLLCLVINIDAKPPKSPKKACIAPSIRDYPQSGRLPLLFLTVPPAVVFDVLNYPLHLLRKYSNPNMRRSH